MNDTFCPAVLGAIEFTVFLYQTDTSHPKHRTSEWKEQALGKTISAYLNYLHTASVLLISTLAYKIQVRD